MALPPELARKVVGFMPRQVQAVATFGLRSATLLVPEAKSPTDLEGHKRRIVDVQFFPAGDRLLTAGHDGTSVVWSAATGRPVLLLRGAHAPGAALFEARVFPDGGRIATVASDGVMVVWSACNGQVLLWVNMSSVCDFHRVVRVLPRSDGLVTGISRRRGDPAAVWDAARWRLLRRLGPPEAGAILFMDTSPCGRQLAATSLGGIFVWAVDDGRLLRRLSAPGARALEVSIAAEGAVVAAAHEGRVFVWGPSGGAPSATISMHRGVDAFVLLPDGRRIVTATDMEVAVWDAVSGQRLGDFEGGGMVPRSIVASASGEVVAACGGTIQYLGGYWLSVWDMRTGRRLGEVVGRSGSYFCRVALGPTSMGDAV